MGKIFQKECLGTIGIMSGIPFVHSEFMWSFAQMVQYNAEYLCGPNEFIHYVKPNTSNHAAARNSLKNQMLGDWLLMLDCDHIFDPDIAVRMLKVMDEYKVQVLTALYTMKEPPYAPVLYTAGVGEKRFHHLDPRLDLKENKDLKILKIASAGAGCLLIKKRVFMEIKDKLKTPPFEIIPPYYEDHSFFIRLQELGIHAYCAPQIECHHLVARKLTIDDYDNSDIDLLGQSVEVESVK